ncbi:TerB family tellurite resistance protein [Vibrio harveyi]|uniref:TerB family tellurite resistance protein n=1 Tax=Vibrio harveyi TaxID=669 RepID=UPI003CE8F276
MIVGQNARLSASEVKIAIQGCPNGVGLFVVPLHSDKTVSGAAITKSGINGAISIKEVGEIELALSQMNEPRYAVVATSLTGTTLAHHINGRKLTVADLSGGIEQVIDIEMQNSNAHSLELLEVYLHNGVWKVRCLLGSYATESDFTKRFGFTVSPNQFGISPSQATQTLAPTQAAPGTGAQGKQRDSGNGLSGLTMPSNTDEARETAGRLLNAGKGWLQRFSSASREKAEEIKTEALKFKSDSFLNAVVAGGVLVGWADGDLSSGERDKLKVLICTNSALSIYDEKDISEKFDHFNAQFSKDFDVGELAAFEALRKVRGDVAKSEFILQLVISIGASDGDFDADERRYARKIAHALDVEPSKFEL